MVYSHIPQGNNQDIFTNTNYPPQSGTIISGIPPSLGDMEYEDFSIMEYEDLTNMEYEK